MSDTVQLSAADVMTREVVTIPPDTTLRQAARLMTRHGVSALPVVKGGVVIGIISDTDLLAPDAMPTPSPDWWLHHLADDAELAPQYLAALRDANRSVGQIMQPSPLWVPPSASLAEVAAMMSREAVRRLLVLQDGVLVGIVSRRDLVRSFANQTVSSR